MATLKCCLTGTPGCEHHALLSHLVTLFWHWTNQPLPYLNNAERQAREQQVSILKSFVWCHQSLKTARSEFESGTFGFPDLPEREVDALLIQPPRLVLKQMDGHLVNGLTYGRWVVIWEVTGHIQVVVFVEGRWEYGMSVAYGNWGIYMYIYIYIYRWGGMRHVRSFLSVWTVP